MDKNCQIPDLVQAFSNGENGGNVFIKIKLLCNLARRNI